MNDQTFQTLLSRLEPAANDPAEALAISYAAGRRDEAAAAQGALLRWRVAAGVLLAATLGLAVHSVGELGDQGAPTQQRAERESGALPVAPDVDRGVEANTDEPVEAMRPLPGSYAALRASVLSDGDVDLDKLPARVGGFGGVGGEGLMRWREAL
jgi:hypothetical protein